MFSPYTHPHERSLDVLRTAELLPFITYGIVNPLGPTLCGIHVALDHSKRMSEVLSFYLNPFEQKVTAVGGIALPPKGDVLVSEVASIIEEHQLFPQACFTLVIPNRTFSTVDTKRLVCFLLSRIGGIVRNLDLIRRFWANPWDRISEEMRGSRDGQIEDNASLSDLQQYVELILEPEHLKPEFEAFMAAWSGAIEFAACSPLKSMPASEFTSIFARLQSAEDPVIGGIRLGMRYSGFVRGKVTDNESKNPGLGVTVAYHGGDQGESTIFIYDRGLSEIPNGATSELLRREFERAKQDVLARGEQIPGGRINIVDQYGTGTRGREPEFLCAEFILSDPNGSRRTFLYLTGANGRFVKIRVMLRTNDAADPTARHFADAVASQLFRAPRGPTLH